MPAVGRHAPEDANMEAAESLAAQLTISVVRALEAEHDIGAKRQRLMAGVPTLHQTDENFNVDAHKMVVVETMPDDKGNGLSGSSTGTRNTTELRVETCSTHRKCTKVD